MTETLEVLFGGERFLLLYLCIAVIAFSPIAVYLEWRRDRRDNSLPFGNKQEPY